jgi:hypothetical protein
MIYFRLLKGIKGSIVSIMIDKRIWMRSPAALVDTIPPLPSIDKEKAKSAAQKRKRIKYLLAEEILQQ